ncbi:MAG: SDR family NAD(P)-dependent oxidoreductase [Ornithinimicrobium sp.]
MTAPVALVAGASRGLGQVIAGELLDRGYRVAICARGAQELAAAVSTLRPRGEVTSHVCDVSQRDQVEALVSSLTAAHGGIDVLITVAGTIQVGPAESMTMKHFEEAMSTMAWGPVHLAWAVLPQMRARRAGRIGTIASIGGIVAPPHLLPYATAKFAAVGFSEGLAAELSGTGVTSTTVLPGLMRTGSHERALFTGQQGREYAWFAPSASLPLISMNAERAAAKIVDGVLAGKPHVALHPMTHLAIRVKGLAPSTTVRAMGLAGRVLPASPSPTRSETIEGHQAARSLNSTVVSGLTTLGSRAARRFGQRIGRRRDGDDPPREGQGPQSN